MRHFELIEGQANKFWEIEQVDTQLQLRWGKINTQGQSQTKDFDSTDAAQAAMEKLIKEKTKKGYIESGYSDVAITQKEPISNTHQETNTLAAPAICITTMPSSALEIPSNTERGDIEPWLAEGTPIQLPKRLQTPYPTRQNPGEMQVIDPVSAWKIKTATLKQRFRNERFELQLPEADQADFLAAIECIKLGQRPEEGSQSWANRVKQGLIKASDRSASFGVDRFILCLACYYGEDAGLSPYFIHHYGLVQAFELLLAAEQIQVTQENNSGIYYRISDQVSDSFHRYGCSESELYFRTALAHTDAATWQQCVDFLRAAIPKLHPKRVCQLAFLFPDHPQFANELLLSSQTDRRSYYLSYFDFSPLLAVATNPAAIELLIQHLKDSYIASDEHFVASVVERHGIDSVRYLSVYSDYRDLVKEAIAAIGTPEAISVQARIAANSKGDQQRLMESCMRWPLASIKALSQMIVANHTSSKLLQSILKTVLHAHNEALAPVWPWLEAAEQTLLGDLLNSMSSNTPLAEPDELPAVLRNAPWRSKKKIGTAAVLQLVVLELAPVEHWGSLRQQFSQLDRWDKQSLEEARNDPAEWVRHFGFRRLENDTPERQRLTVEATNAIKNQDAAALIAAWQTALSHTINASRSYQALVLLTLSSDSAALIWNSLPQRGMAHFRPILAHCGLAILPSLVELIEKHSAYIFDFIMPFGACAFAPLVAQTFTKKKSLRKAAQAWLLQFPEHAITGLLPALLGKAAATQQEASQTLRFLAQHGHTELIQTVGQRYQNNAVDAAIIDWLAQDPLDFFPKKITATPDYFQIRAVRRPVLHNGHALPDTALEDLLTMLRFPNTGEAYAGLAQVQAACQAQSLADFAWDIYEQWTLAGAPSKEGWAFTQLGLFGNDDTARKLNVLIRLWPGEGLNARAVTGLDILTAIGSDVALMLLNGIAQKVKFKGLQDKAQEKIAEIAEARELTSEELADRLAPDLGLDDNGTLQLDFGPRQFVVGFDETLKPFVRDMDGLTLKDLPKPKQSDDAELAKAATERFKSLKKDARTIASQQIQRLESAMCQRRRWPQDVFVQFLATHPLLRHLVHRLVWAAYTVEGDGRFGGQLLSTFRISSDGSYSNADDDEYTLPEGDIRIGLPHALEMPEPDNAAFAQLFADYELLQPFTQLGREHYQLSAEDAAQAQLLRWKNQVVATGKLLGLSNKGWRRGEAQDGGGIWYYTKDIGNDRLIELTFEPGMIVGLLEEYPEQTLDNLNIAIKTKGWHQASNQPFTTLDPIVTSELVRDMESLIN